MRCPNCQGLMEGTIYERVNIKTCPGCGGTFVDEGRLRTIERRREAKVTGVDLPRVEDHEERKIRCPRCRLHMRKYRYCKDAPVNVDQCPSCKGLWFDAGELEAVQVAFQKQEDEGTRQQAQAQGQALTRQRIAANFARRLRHPPAAGLIARCVLSLILLAGPATVLLYLFPVMHGPTFWLVYMGIWALMLLIACFVEFCPDESDLGWFGGWMDNPFSYRDDINRHLLFLRIIFTPANFVLDTATRTWRFLKS